MSPVRWAYMVGAHSDTGSSRNGTEDEQNHNGVGEWFRQHLLSALNGRRPNGKPRSADAPVGRASEEGGRNSISDSVSTVFETKLSILREAMQEIDSGLSERGRLNDVFEDQIDAEVAECADLLGKLPYPWSEGFQVQVEFLRSSLHKSLLTRRKDKRSEQLAYWDDVTQLLERKRQLLMEYQNLLATRDSLARTGAP